MSLKNDTQVLAISNNSLPLAKKVVIVDGMIGGGKNLLSSIVSSLPNVEMWLYKSEIEHVCALHYLGHISLDAAKTLINKLTEEEIYNQSISRNVNFKPSDHSGLFYASRPFRYIKRLFRSPSKARESLKKEMPILNLMTHVNTSYSKPLFEALGERLVYIRVSRHPMSVYMLKHNKKWNEYWTTGDRIGPILYNTYDKKNHSIDLPFYAKNIEKIYIDANSTDRAIMLIDQWIRNSDNFIDEVIKSSKATILEVPYEKFVFQPRPYVEKIASSLGVKINSVTNKEMRRQGVPRSSLTDAPKDKVYSNMNRKHTKKNLTLAENFAQGRAFAEETASSEALSILDELSKDYEERHNIKK